MDKYERAIAGGSECPESECISNEMTLREWVTYYLLKEDKSVSFSRYSNFKAFEKNVFPEIGDKRLIEVSEEDIRKINKKLYETLGHNTVWGIFREMRQVLKAALKHGLIDVNPCSGIRDFHYIPTEKIPFSEEELYSINQVIPLTDSPVREMYRLCFACGIKRSEMLALRWSDIDFEHRIISICNVVERLTNPEFCKDVSSKNIRYSMTDEARNVLEVLPMGAAGSLVFCNEDGSPIKYSVVERNNELIKEKSGVKDFSFRRITTHVQCLKLN